MKKQFYFLLISIMLTFQSCFGGNYMNNLEGTINYITRKTAQEIEKEIPILELAGIGGSLKDNVINHEKLVFNLKGKLDRDKGVVLIARVVEVYLKNIYSEKRMKAYLEKHPFTYKNLQVIFVVYDEEGNDVYHPDIGFISLLDGIVSYQTVSKSEKEFYKIESNIKESYEEAAKRLGVWQNH